MRVDVPAGASPPHLVATSAASGYHQCCRSRPAQVAVSLRGQHGHQVRKDSREPSHVAPSAQQQSQRSDPAMAVPAPPREAQHKRPRSRHSAPVSMLWMGHDPSLFDHGTLLQWLDALRHGRGPTLANASWSGRSSVGKRIGSLVHAILELGGKSGRSSFCTLRRQGVDKCIPWPECAEKRPSALPHNGDLCTSQELVHSVANSLENHLAIPNNFHQLRHVLRVYLFELTQVLQSHPTHPSHLLKLSRAIRHLRR
jgi:hypothetical protein